MADFEDFDSALEKALSALAGLGISLKLRSEQKQAVTTLLSRQDLLAVLPTGFGKSLIFQLLVRVKEILTGKPACVIVVCPLKSIVHDQLSEATAMGLTATSLSDASLEDVENGKYQLIFGSAEEILEKPFLGRLKNSNTPLHQNLAALIVDESHTVETWTGQRATTRKSRQKGTVAFRESFGKLGELRSFFNQGTPVGALTGTADTATQKTIMNVLCLRSDATKIYVSPNRVNLRFSVKKEKKDEQLKELKWLVDLIRELKNKCPKTIVFCNTMNEIALVVNHLICELGKDVFLPECSSKQDNCLIGIYHSNSWQSSKDRVLKEFKATNGVKRILIATTALCMGVNFPDVRYIINWGPARSILDQHQEAGRAGRDGEKSHIFVLYHGQQAAHCEQEVKDFIRAKGCLRVAAYLSLDATIKPLEPLHDCCSFCTTICMCAGTTCTAEVLPFEHVIQNNDNNAAVTDVREREVTEGDRKTLEEALYEVLADMRHRGLSFDESSSHGFSKELIEDIVKNCQHIFTVQDLMSNFPVFSLLNSLRVLEVVQEVFMDIPNFEETSALYNLNSNLHVQRNSSVSEWFDFNNIDLGFDSDSDEMLEL